MNYLKSIFALSVLVLFVGLFSAHAQWNEGVAALTKTEVPLKVKNVVIDYLKATKGEASAQALRDLKAGNILGFNIGMPPTKNVIIIIIPSSRALKQSDRLPYDALGISAELGAGLKEQGLFPSRNIAFKVNTQTMSLEKFSGTSGTGKTRQ